MEIKINYRVYDLGENVKMKKVFNDYYVGLDVGTSSVGWAVTDKNYRVLKFNGKSMWGVRLFNEADSAESRRVHRSERRRTDRRRQRISLLQELFAKSIAEVDEKFFLRMKESKFWPEDKFESGNQTNTLFNDENYKDKDFHNEFKSIYHLRAKLLEGDEKTLKDPRNVYLACHHILKHRGHFLFAGELNTILNDISEEVYDLSQIVNDEYGVNFECKDINKLTEVLKDKRFKITDKKNIFKELFVDNDAELRDKKIQTTLAELLAGAKKDIVDLLESDDIGNEEKHKKLSFGDGDLEDNISEYEEVLKEKLLVVLKLKSIYDWGVLAQILKGNQYISKAKVETYEKHAEDLSLLKNILKNGFTDTNEYKKMFRSVTEKDNYCAYIGSALRNGKKVSVKSCTYDDFTKNLKKVLEKITGVDKEKEKILREIENKEFLPKQVNKNNGVIPYQVHRNELQVILQNAERYHEFLRQEDEYGTVSDKIISILSFRIPYYVGPLNTNNKGAGFCWAKVDKDIKIKPWNFDETVDKEASAEAFILRMTNKCVYLPWADVLPKHSILYQTYMILNELNNVKVDEKKLTVEQKQDVFENLFKIQKKVSNRDFIAFLKRNGYIENNSEKPEITGIDGSFKASMSSYYAFKNIFKDKEVNEKVLEDIIKLSTIFGSEKNILLSKLRKEYGNILTDEELKQIKGLSFNGWASFSREFLTEVTNINRETGEYECILRALYNSQENLMQLLSNEHDFSDNIIKLNKEKMGVSDTELTYKKVENLYVSPAVKRAIWQALSILLEIKKITGKNPEKVFIEMARGQDGSSRKVSRKSELQDTYKNAKKDIREWEAEGVVESLEAKSDEQLRQKKLYLWYTQLGRCMYSGEAIHLEDLLSSNSKYDIDHIYPQSKIDDDSSRNNTVLVLKEYNAEKNNDYPLPSKWRKSQESFWNMLKKNKLITEEKYKRLTRSHTLTDSELANFAARQLVETRQSTKEIAKLIDESFDGTKVVYVKAKNVSSFRQGVDDTVYGYRDKLSEEKERIKQLIWARQQENQFIKSRAVNDYHHAKDAYLNIVVGNVHNIKYTDNPLRFIKKEINDKRFDTHSIRALYKFEVNKNGYVAWKPSSEKEEGTMSIVRKQMNKNDILFTRMLFEKKHGQNGGLYDQNIVKAQDGLQPIKGSDERLHNTARYGGYKTVTPAYFMLVEYEGKKGKHVKRIETVPLYMKNRFSNDSVYRDEVLNRFAEKNKLKNPKVLIERIKFNTLFDINGFKMHLTGSNEKQIYFWNANQLVLNKEYQQYIKKLENFDNRLLENKNSKITAFDEITEEQNEKLYDEFVYKLKNTVYNEKLGAQVDTLEKAKDNFKAVSIEDQVILLLEILKMFGCFASGANLKKIKSSAKAGLITSSKDISVVKELRLINQSITGLFENEINISEL